jgi:hypothetical protein
MLTLPIKKKWFVEIISGRKKTEYRRHNTYYETRLLNAYGGNYFDRDKEILICLKNGYRKDSPSIIIKVKRIDLVPGTTEKYLNPLLDYYALQIKAVSMNNQIIWEEK